MFKSCRIENMLALEGEKRKDRNKYVKKEISREISFIFAKC
jgi:hypothetical protein